MLDPATLPHLPTIVSEPRFAPYLARYEGRVDLALRLYTWNIEASAAFIGPLNVLEVALRNSMHDVLRAGRRDDWWNDSRVHLLERDRRIVEKAARTLERRGQSSPSPDQIVAALPLGFWVGLTDGGVPRDHLLSYETTLWQPRLVKAFPSATALRRKTAHRKFTDVRLFRNRVAHHEPVYRAPLAAILNDIIEVAGWLHPEVAALIDGTHRVHDVLERRRAAVSLGRCAI